MRKPYSANFLFLILFGLSSCGFVRAQGTLTVRETGEINYQAKNVIGELENLLNFVAFADNAPNELAEVMRKSYAADSRSQIFYARDVVVEDDVDPAYTLGNTRDLPVDKYLNTLDVFYEKTVDPSIRFENIRVSDVRKKEFLYVNVYFDCVFAGRHSQKKAAYAPRPRQATVRLAKKGNRWQALVCAIAFHDPKRRTNGGEGRVAVVSDAGTDTPAGRTPDPDAQAAVQQAVDRVASEREDAERKARDAAYNEAIGIANAAMAENDYQTALDAYRRAIDYNAFAPLPRVQIGKIERLFTNRYESLRTKAKFFEDSRSYEQAIDYYRKAAEAKPDAAAELQPKITALTGRVAETLAIRNLLAAGKTEEAIERCDDLIKLKTKQKRMADYPDLYLLRAGAYAKSRQRNAAARAVEDYAAALRSDPNYLEAYLARAAYHESRQELDMALTDYDYVTVALLPQEAKYYLKKAQLKEQMGMGKRAVEDYDKAISLSPNNPLYHLQKGMLESRNRDWEAARRSFDKALQLNVTYTEAYVRRGLAAAEQEKAAEAAADFRKAEQLGGLDSALVKYVIAKSNDYHSIGATALRNGDVRKAERMFDLALALHPKNSGVWISRGDAQYRKGDMLKAVAFYAAALQANSRDAEAHYKKGMAQGGLKQYRDALESFAAALRLDPAHLEAYQGRAELHVSVRQYAAALADYRRIVDIALPLYKQQQRNMQTDAALKTRLASACTQMAACHLALQEPTAAADNANQALLFDPASGDAYFQRGLAYQALRRPADAAESFARAAKQHPDRLSYQNAHARAALQAGDYAAALPAYSRVLVLDTRQTLRGARYQRGICHYHLNHIEEALRDFTMHELGQPKEADADFYAYYGLAHLRKRHTAVAAKYLKKALALKAANGMALLGMGCLAAQQHKPAEALVWLRKAFQSKQLDQAAVRREEESHLRDVRFGSATAKQYSALRKATFAGAF